VQIEAYRFEEAERLRFGKFPVLDTVLSRWARGIEESVFSLLGLEAYAGASVVEEMRFAEFFRSLKHARPIYLFKLDPFPGQGLLVLDNRLANACLHDARSGGRSGAPEGGADRLRLTPGNQERLQRVVQAIMERFDGAWADVEPVRTELLKVTTYLFRARVYHAYEQCLVAQLHLSGERLSARIMLCVPRFMLAGAIAKAARRPVVPAVAPAPFVSRATAERVLGPARYEVTARLGSMTMTLGPGDFRVGEVIPLVRPAEGDVVLEANGTPLLVGEAGDSAGRYAVRVTGVYRPAVARSEPPPFRPVVWRTVSD
jgi:flagellar motor switch protein FliM